MSKENKSFASAFKHLLGKKDDVIEDIIEEVEEKVQDDDKVVPTYLKNTSTNNVFADANPIPFKSKENYISPSAVFVGTVETKEGMAIDGIIKGSVTSGDAICLKGSIEGNIITNSISVNGGAVKGDITAAKSLQINDDGIIIGNITSESCVIDGKIKGNIVSTETIYLKANASVFGDITAKKINIKEGSVVYGQMKVLNEYQINEGAGFEKLLDLKLNAGKNEKNSKPKAFIPEVNSKSTDKK